MSAGADATFGPVAADLARLEEVIRGSFGDDHPAAAAPMADLFASGGKRLRPALVLLCAHLGEYRFDRVAPAAIAVELTHAATLVHDDVIDRSPTRRGRPTAAASAGSEAAILVGDHYFARAYLESSRTGLAEVVSELAAAVMRICAAELEQQAALRNYHPSLESYMMRIEGKTAALLAACCRIGGLLGGLDSPDREALGRYGNALGLAFQIADDVLDYTSEESELGKPVGHDLLEGSATLPLMLSEGLDRMLPDGRRLSAETVDAVVREVRSGQGPQRALARASELADEARAELARFGEREAARTLDALATYVVSRKL
ncbi:MAG: polyprenyl synthetase family protein [Chloroflexi bacterium]|nr:MAG: polyprenyl synthetase family protein [Chloroflexota bacterium]